MNLQDFIKLNVFSQGIKFNFMQHMISLFLLLFAINATAQKNYLVVGTYTKTGSEGIYVYNFDTANGDAQLVSTKKSSNPSYLTAVDNKYIYAVNESDSASLVLAYSFNNGQLDLINSVSSGGKNPCYVAATKMDNKNYLSVANYTSGSFSFYATNKDGALLPALQTVLHQGKSVVVKRQMEPHAHAAVFNNKYLYVPDLGIDKVMVYGIDLKKEPILTSQNAATSMPGSGPRHIIFSKNNFAYLVEELSGTVAAFAVSANGELSKIQGLSTHTENYNGVIGSADIRLSPNGKFLYVSNRGGANDIAIFKVDAKTGLLTIVGHQEVLGKTPRHFNFSPNGRLLLVANQLSNEIVIFNADANTGLLTDSGKRLKLPSPVCIAWINN